MPVTIDGAGLPAEMLAGATDAGATDAGATDAGGAEVGDTDAGGRGEADAGAADGLAVNAGAALTRRHSAPVSVTATPVLRTVDAIRIPSLNTRGGQSRVLDEQ